LPVRGGFGWQRDLDAAYGRNDLTDWARLTDRYELDYALVETTNIPTGSRVAYRNAEWAVLDLGPPTNTRSTLPGPD
jgi:hypothetical protein